VMSGFARCGEWFAVDRWGVVPDMITFAKGVNSGYVPLGGVVLSPRVYEAFADRPFPGGLTYSGHPLGCAAAVATIQVMRAGGIPERVRELGEQVVRPRLEKLREAHPSVGDVRGLGMFWAIELVRDRSTREMLVPYNASGEAARPMAEFAAACKARGLWPFTHFNRVHVVPPCVITAEELNQGLDIIDEALEVTDRYC
jgi:taurine---2-oxoglutarate transaminase